MKGFNLFVFALLLILSSCSNSLDMIDPVDPIPIVYLKMNPQDSLFYLTLTRTFSGEGSAYEMARNANQVFYDSAKVSLEAWGQQYKVWESQFELSDRSKIPGIFSEGPGYCFETTNEFSRILGQITSFRLVIDLSGQLPVAFSRIPFLPEPVQLVPSRFDHVIHLYPDNYDLLFSVDREVKYGELLCEFHYQEFDEYDETWINQAVTFSLRKDIMINRVTASTYLYPDLFFNRLKMSIKPINDVMRKFTNLSLIFLAGDQYYKDYIDTYENSGNLDLAPKGNINNGYGLFTMVRSIKIENMTLGKQTHDSLSMGEITMELGFVKW